MWYDTVCTEAQAEGFGRERKENMQRKRFSMLGALWMALILLTVWAVPAAMAETASEGDDSA